MNKNLFYISLFLLLIISPLVLAVDSEEILVFGGIDLEEVIGIIVGLISLVLFVLTFMAYNRDGRKRFLYVSLAFLLFAIKSFLDSFEIFGTEIEIFGPIAVILELLVILFFFFGVIKKEA